MKKFSLLLVGFSLLFIGASDAAPAPRAPVQRRASATAPASAPSATTASTGVSSARAAAVRTAPAVTAARSGGTPVVAARAATAPKQNVIQQGTTVGAAVANTVVNAECREKYEGCMDSFCMLDNESGGRCLCSDKKSELDGILADIEKINAQAVDMNTRGVERIALGAGDKADYVLNTAATAEKESATGGTATQRTGISRPQINLDIFSAPSFEDDIFGAQDVTSLEGKTGNALHSAVRDICVAQIPECAADMRMLQLMYAQTIQSNCTAYENDLKKRRLTVQQNLATAQRNLRDAALKAYEDSNKWDLGGCAVQMRLCMQDIERGGCGDDWTGCVGIVAAENARGTSRVAQRDIAGAATKISIAASTYDALLSKKPLCESITNSCVNAVAKDKDAVWNTFLREIAPQLKTAELMAESDRRTSCIGNISECFRKGCQDTIDPNNPEGSFDMCLSRPEAMLSICKIPLNECGISTVSAAEAQKSQIWAFVQSRLAAMRVDSCTNEFKQCLQSEDRCGPDYTQCVGLDREKVIALCPAQKLLTCPGKDSDYFDELVSGIMMGVDTGQLSVCQATVESKMEELCGGMAGCNQFENDANFGAESLAFDDMHTDRVSIKGLIDFSKLTISNNAVNVSDMNGSSAAASNAGLNYIANKINNVIGMLKADMTIRKCIEGSNMSQITRRGGTNTARFENLLDMPIANIINSGLSAARMNYNDKLEEMKVKAVAVIKGKLEKISEEQAEKMCYPAEQMPAAE